MTREEIERSYVTRNGIIKSPGKFEGEPVWAPYLYDLWMEGCPDKQGGNQEEGTNAWAAYVVDDAMRAEFPTLGACQCARPAEGEHGLNCPANPGANPPYAVGIEETDSGRVYSQELSKSEFDALEDD